MLIGSTNSFTPCDSNTWSPAPWPFSSIIRPYWKPEQPPPCTNTRSPLPALFSSLSSSLIFDAAVSDTLIIGHCLLGPTWRMELPAIIARTCLIYCRVSAGPKSLCIRHMPYILLPPTPRAELDATAEARWNAIVEARPELSTAVELQRRLLARVMTLTRTIERGRLPRLSLPPQYLAAKLARGVPVLAGEPIPLPVAALADTLMKLCDELAEGGAGEAAEPIRTCVGNGTLEPRPLLGAPCTGD